MAISVEYSKQRIEHESIALNFIYIHITHGILLGNNQNSKSYEYELMVNRFGSFMICDIKWYQLYGKILDDKNRNPIFLEIFSFICYCSFCVHKKTH